MREIQQPEFWAAPRGILWQGRRIRSLFYTEKQIRGGEKTGGERRQLLKPVPKWMNEWVTHINDCCDGLTYCSSVSG